MHFRFFILFIQIILQSQCSGKKEAAEKVRPKILFIMGDDHITQIISCYNGLFADYAKTINIDRLASEGMLFRNTYCTNAICSPAMAALLTGKHSDKNDDRCLGQTFDSSQVNVASVPQKTGFETAVFWKWHLKSTPTGFDEYKVLQVQGRYQDAFKEKLLELWDKFDNRGFEYNKLQEVIGKYW